MTCIEMDQLNLLPEGGVPSKLLSVVKYSGETQLLEQEREGYVLEDDDDDDDDSDNSGELVSRPHHLFSNDICSE